MPNEIIPQRNSCFLLSLSFSCTFLSFFPALSFLLLFWQCTVIFYSLSISLCSQIFMAPPHSHIFCLFFSGWVECYLYKNPILFYSVCQLARVSERPLTCTPERLGQVSVLHKDLKAKDTDSRVLTLVNQVGVSRHFTGIDTDRSKRLEHAP